MCQIRGNNGQIYASGDKALLLLYGLGACNWRLDTRPAHTSPMVRAVTSPQNAVQPEHPGTVSPSSLTQIPRRTSFINSDVINTLSRHQRRIFILVDGVRNVGKIVALSGTKDEQEVFKILRNLVTIGLVTL